MTLCAFVRVVSFVLRISSISTISLSSGRPRQTVRSDRGVLARKDASTCISVFLCRFSFPLKITSLCFAAPEVADVLCDARAEVARVHSSTVVLFLC